MLVLSRKLGEAITITGGIEVTVVSIQGDKVRLGFTAPPEVKVWRNELSNGIERMNDGNQNNSGCQ